MQPADRYFVAGKGGWRVATTPRGHEKAVQVLYNCYMSKTSKHPSQRDDLKRWDEEGGAPRSGHPSHEPSFAPESNAESALYYFNVRTPSGVLEDPEGDTYSSLQAARACALDKARDMIADGNQKGEDRRSWHVEIMDRANHLVLAVPFSEVLGPEAAG